MVQARLLGRIREARPLHSEGHWCPFLVGQVFTWAVIRKLKVFKNVYDLGPTIDLEIAGVFEVVVWSVHKRAAIFFVFILYLEATICVFVLVQNKHKSDLHFAVYWDDCMYFGHFYSIPNSYNFFHWDFGYWISTLEKHGLCLSAISLYCVGSTIWIIYKNIFTSAYGEDLSVKY